ncbi:MAG TPA: universal stress protein [Rhodobacteraceae bacterium]|nr:universal stress protein [Paracoccaceae bacterium]
MSNTFLLAVDGSSGSQNAIEFATVRAKAAGAKIIVVYVIEWSPYSFNTPEENEQRHKRREEEIEKATKTIVEPVAAEIKKAGVEVETIVRHGNPARTVAELAENKNAVQIFIGRTGETGLKTLIFGSVVANLVQTSTVPVTVVP